MTLSRRLAPLTAAAACALCAAPSAHAATELVIKGAGFGHGVGMSQYGAYGYAQHGAGFRDILKHYYTGTQVGTYTDAGDVTVLLRASPTMAFTGATQIAGRALDPAKTYSVKVSGAQVVLRSPTGRKLVTFSAAVRIANGGAPVKLMGPAQNGVSDGLYRGAIEFRPEGDHLLAINALGLEEYVRGVVGGESPASWPAEALKAQAVAARTYAVATSKAGNGFQQYSDTRSQVYKGIAAETLSTDAAVAGTARQVVTYLGQPIVAYFFSTSGGKTENVENSFIGSAPSPYLKSVEDPYDDLSPKHRWSARFSLPAAQKKLGSLVQGSLKEVVVVKRGASPRVVTAQVVGSRGTTVVTGPQLRAKLGLFDTWATFSTISTNASRAAAPRAVAAAAGRPQDGVSLRAAALSAAPASASDAHVSRRRIAGAITGAKPGDWIQVESQGRKGWHRAFWLQADAGGAYAGSVPKAGVYRVYWRGLTGPAVRVR